MPERPFTARTTSPGSRPARAPTVSGSTRLMMGRAASGPTDWKAEVSNWSSVLWKSTPMRSSGRCLLRVTSRNWMRFCWSRLEEGGPGGGRSGGRPLGGLRRHTRSLCAGRLESARSAKRTFSRSTPSTSTTLSPGWRMEAASESGSRAMITLVGSRVNPGDPLCRFTVRLYSLRRMAGAGGARDTVARWSRPVLGRLCSRANMTVTRCSGLGLTTSLSMRPPRGTPSMATILS
mmetsp:Transcript_1874/g.6191  ORF Transcript_1874/g.6191 Transcript_1874/m.6191 type:complete len:234 (+) Transcript_1874:115-816(+)